MNNIFTEMYQYVKDGTLEGIFADVFAETFGCMFAIFKTASNET